MKKLLALSLLLVFIFCGLPVSLPSAEMLPVDEGDASVLDAFYDYVESNTTVTYHPDGSVTYTLAPADASISVQGIAQQAGFIMEANQSSAMASTIGTDYGYTTGQSHTWLPITQKYIYTMLNILDKTLYLTIYNDVKNLEEESSLGVELLDSKKYRLYYAVMFDNPELFYLCNTVATSDNGNGTHNLVYSYAASRDEYCIHGHTPSRITPELKEKILAKKDVFDSTVNSFIATIPSNAPEVIKERLIYAKILRSSYYNLSAQWNNVCEDNWNAYGIICNGYGVCESYAEAFQTLCNAVGIQCTGIVGTAGGPHKWNAVKIDNEWYQCDITFDDPIGGDPNEAYNFYFNRTDAWMVESHHYWDNEESYYMGYVSTPVSTATQHTRENFIAYYEEDTQGTIHCFVSRCDSTCENCSFIRDIYDPVHLYSSPMDTDCGHCGQTRLAGWCWDANNDGWYYYYDGNPLINTWKKDSKGWCYLGYNGKMLVNTTHRDDKGLFTVDVNGHCYINRWFKNEWGEWYYANASGYHVTNKWFLWNGKWYYLAGTGRMATNEWIRDSKGDCFVGADGVMATNKWVPHGGWYFVDSSGHKVTNTWKKDSKGWVYLGSDGAMVTNKWLRDSKGWCYVDFNGYCVTNEWKRDGSGKLCYLNANGNMVTNGWVYDNKWHYNAWFYMDANGYKVTGKQVIGGEVHVFDSYGRWLYKK